MAKAIEQNQRRQEMKIIYIECDAEEMRANRTILDNMSEVFVH